MESGGAIVSAGEAERSGGGDRGSPRLRRIGPLGPPDRPPPPSDGMAAAKLERYRVRTVARFRQSETDRKTDRNLSYFFAGVTAAGLILSALLILTASPHQPLFFTGNGAGLILSGGGMLELRRLGRARGSRPPF